MRILFFLLIFVLFLQLSTQLSNPLIYSISSHFQTGRSILFSSTLNSSPYTHTITFPTPMSNSSLNCTLSILGLKHDYSSVMFGFIIKSTMIDETSLIVQVNTYNMSTKLKYLRIGYMVTSQIEIHTNWYQFTFSSTSDNVMNPAVPGLAIPICVADVCKGGGYTLSYDKIGGTKKVFVYITGYRIQSMGLTPGNQIFGVGVSNVVPSNNNVSCTLDVLIYGNALLKQLTVEYISFELQALNVLNNKVLIEGISRVGCDFVINTWKVNSTTYNSIGCKGDERANMNTTLISKNSGFSTYYANSFMMGFNLYVSGSTSGSISMNFDISSTSISGSTSYDSIYDFSGPTSGQFTAYHPYFILLQFYCNPLAVDKYYVYNQNKCDSGCALIGQYFDSNNFCRLCNPICYQCYTQQYLCTSCNITHNRVLSGTGNLCICDPSGYYDDGSSLVCPKCHYSCKSCLGPGQTQCISCPDIVTNFRATTVDSCPCMPGYFDNGAQICVKCHYTCLTCSGVNNNNCITCNSITNYRQISTTSTCPCIAGYFNTGSNPICSKCHYSCYTCSTISTNCTSCNTTIDQRSTLIANTCPCKPSFYDDGNKTCKQCHVTCFTCFGPDKEDCQSCQTPGLRALELTYCKCKQGYYDYLDICYPCDYSCYNCTAGTSTSCINCDDMNTFRYYIPLTKQCKCKNGYFDVVNSLTCQQCDPKCKTCENTTLTCLSCDSTKFRELSGTSCLCITGYVDMLSTNGQCQKCHYSCYTCSGITDTQCTSCNNSIRNLISNSCLCPLGRFDNSINVTCQLCHPECKACTDRYDYSCIECQVTYKREILTLPASGPCGCITGYFENNNALVCDFCQYSCLTCSVIATNCTSCDTTNNFRFLSSNSQCLCIEHYYDVSSPICKTCITTCRNCSLLPDNCTSCYNDRYLSSNICLCKAGTFENILQICTSCSYTCLTCQTSLTTCLTCPSLSFRTLTNATCPCNDLYYDNNSIVCLKCPYYCNTCIGPTLTLKCLTCPLLSYRTIQSSGICTCNFGYYDDGSSQICRPCKNTCESCSSFSVCLTCYVEQFRVSVGGVCKCNAGYYDNLINLVCQSCHYSCATCTGPLATNCLTCNSLRSYATVNKSCPCSSGYYQFMNICYPCSNQCLTCSIIPNNCTSCSAGDRYLLNNNCLCKEGFYDNGGVCIACDVKCRTCANTATNCLACNIMHKTTLSGSSCVCGNTQYQNPTTLICTACHYSCYQCTSATNTSCSSCSATNFRTFNPSSLACDCNPGYFDNSTAKCIACNSKCLTCYGPTQLNCLTCHTGEIKLGSRCQLIITCPLGFYYFQGQCILQCPNTTYSNTNICQPCINNCKTCLSVTACSSCLQNYYFNSTAFTCTETCPLSSYVNFTSNKCQPCPVGCRLCNLRNGTIVCSQCMTSYYLYDYAKCVDSTFCVSPNFVISSNYCFKCSFPCKTCTSLLFNGCLTCEANYIFFNGQCLLNCPEGYYSNSANFCVTCEVNCLKCSSEKCQKCVNNFYLTPDVVNPKCIRQKYFYDSSTNSELPCHPNCFTCTNKSFSSCLICQKSRGDQSQLAISGYCDCWEDSLELGNGVCSKEEFESLQSYTKVLKSSSDSVFYLNVVAGLGSANILTGAAFILYEQSYSNLYFVNSSIVLQSDLVLKEMLNRNLNFYLNRKKNELFDENNNKISKNNIYHRRRRLIQVQNNFSLFTRGQQQTYKYLYQFSIYTILCILFTWFTIFLTHFLINLKLSFLQKSPKILTILNKIKLSCQQSILIFIHIFTISEISLYGIGQIKYFIQNNDNNNDNTTLNLINFLQSMIILIYYIVYTIRLFVGVYKVHRIKKIHLLSLQQQQQSIGYIYKIKILFVQFNKNKNNDKGNKNKNNNLSLLMFIQNYMNNKENINKIQVMKLLLMLQKFKFMEKMYLSMFMVRMVLMSAVVVLFSINPQMQVLGVVGVFLVWIIYSLIWCPYGKVFRVFIHLNQIIYLLQLGGLLYEVSMQQGQSRLMPAYVIMSLNGIQLFLFILFSLTILYQTLVGLCQKVQNHKKSNKISNIFNQNNQDQHQNFQKSNNLNKSQGNLLNPCNQQLDFQKFDSFNNLSQKQYQNNHQIFQQKNIFDKLSIITVDNQNQLQNYYNKNNDNSISPAEINHSGIKMYENDMKIDLSHINNNNINNDESNKYLNEFLQNQNNNMTSIYEMQENNDIIVRKRYRVVKKGNKKKQ